MFKVSFFLSPCQFINLTNSLDEYDADASSFVVCHEINLLINSFIIFI